MEIKEDRDMITTVVIREIINMETKGIKNKDVVQNALRTVVSAACV
jgi:hypothetical protein